jgi:hypothetical protein
MGNANLEDLPAIGGTLVGLPGHPVERALAARAADTTRGCRLDGLELAEHL